MKLSDVTEVQDIGKQLDANEELRKWLETFPERGLKLYANNLISKIPLSRETSLELLNKHKAGCIARLKELAIEE